MKHPLFPDQRDDEKVILFLRRHWMIIGKHIFRLGILMLVPIPVIGMILSLDFTVNFDSPLYILVVMGIGFYYIFVWLFYYHEFLDYHLDVWIVTDQRIISIEQEGLFNHTSSELTIDKIQDVTAEIKGKRQTFLNYGSVHIQTAGESQRFIFEEVPNPTAVAKVITQVHDQIMAKRRTEQNYQPLNNNVLTTQREQAHDEERDLKSK